MNNEPAVSIVLPTYNGTRYLAESVQSCLDQTYQDFELIIVDDCSTDDTPQLITEFAAKDKRIRPFRNESNLRLPKSLNAGFARSRGRYLTWTSDDNLYLPNAIEVMVAALEREPDVGMVYTPQTCIDKNSRDVGFTCFGGPADALAYNNPVGASFLYRREVYESVGDYSAELFLVEDWDYWIRIAEKFPVRLLPEIVYKYRIHDDSLSRQKLESCKRATRELLEQSLPRMHWASREAKGHGYLVAARIAWMFGERRNALGHILRAAGYSPFYTLRRFVEEPFDRILKRRWHRRTSPDKDPGTVSQMTLWNR
jgi:glycosyltransferase involved in cell wall biosynthesis